MNRLIDIAWRLDRLRWTPAAVLSGIVTRDGACMWPVSDGPPDWLDLPMTDHMLAARICAACPVQDECLELELRTAGANTLGVWGALAEDDRRALHPLWLARGDRAMDRGA